MTFDSFGLPVSHQQGGLIAVERLHSPPHGSYHPGLWHVYRARRKAKAACVSIFQTRLKPVYPRKGSLMPLSLHGMTYTAGDQPVQVREGVGVLS